MYDVTFLCWTLHALSSDGHRYLSLDSIQYIRNCVLFPCEPTVQCRTRSSIDGHKLRNSQNSTGAPVAIMTQIISHRYLGFGFSTVKGLFSLRGHEKFSHELRFDSSFPTLAFSLHLQRGSKTSTGNGPEYVTRMAAACPETKN